MEPTARALVERLSELLTGDEPERRGSLVEQLGLACRRCGEPLGSVTQPPANAENRVAEDRREVGSLRR